MDEKDPKDEELNPQGQDDVNEADDSFGLPDLDYKPLDEDASDSEEELSSEDENSDAAEEEPAVEDTEANEEAEPESGEDSSVEEEEEEGEQPEKPALRYQIEESSSNAPKIIGGIIGVLALAAIIWYFGFYQKEQKALADIETAKQEQIDAQKAADAAAARAQKVEADAAAAEEARLAAEMQEKANTGVQILTERSGRYYIVLESFIDADFAEDFGNKIAKEGTASFLIPPYSKKKMQRVAIGGYDSMDEAQSALNNLSSEFGEGKWILKY